MPSDVSEIPSKKSVTSLKSDTSLPCWEKIAFGSGGMCMFYGNVGINSTAIPFYQMIMGVNPALLGLALAIPRFLDAITDPLMGNISDNFRSRWGRRRPFILFGAIAMSITYGLVWMVPEGWSEFATVGWLIATSLFFYLAYTMFAVPFNSLSYEMSPDYDERTSVMAHVTFWTKVAETSYQWIIPLASLGVFVSVLSGTRWICWGVAVLFMGVMGSVPAVFSKERYYDIRLKEEVRSPFWSGLGNVLGNRAFIILIILALLQVISGMLASSLDYYLLVYYIFDGDIAQGSVWKGFISTGYALCGFLGIPLVGYWARHTTKRRVLCAMYVLMILNGICRWFVYVPGHQKYLFLDPLLGGLFWIGIGMVVPSMIADVCDDDELKHGMRREGMFGATYSWIVKMALSLSALASGIALNMVGFHVKLGGLQTHETFLRMRLAMVLGGIVPSILAIVLLSFYPLSRKRMLLIRATLEGRRGTVDQEDSQTH